jgi:glycerol-3-phosphate dehydrogenase subunit B
VGLPAVLGVRYTSKIIQNLEKDLGLPVFEIPTLPPSIPGLRLNQLLSEAIKNNGGQILEGLQVVNFEQEEESILRVFSAAASRLKAHRAKTYVLATGGILGGGITIDYKGYAKEVIFNLPYNLPSSREAWFNQEFLSTSGHPFHQSGISVNSDFMPVNHNGVPLFSNLYAVGTGLAHSNPIQTRSLEGIALMTGYWVGNYFGSNLQV